MLRIADALETQLRDALQRAFPEAWAEAGEAGLDPQLAPASKPEFGDFQANGAPVSYTHLTLPTIAKV